MKDWNGNPYPTENVLASVGKGWHMLVEALIADLFALGWDGSVYQVKEKFGGLRFYIGPESPKIASRIRQAEIESYKTCEHCGRKGKQRDRPWIKTLCDRCDQEHPSRV